MMRVRRQSGLTLVEVIVALVLLSILMIPAMQAMQTGIVGADVHQNVAIHEARLSMRLEEMLAELFPDLVAAAVAAGGPSNATAYSDAAGPPDRLLVYLALYDGDDADGDGNAFTGGDPDLLWVRVAVEDSIFAFETVTTVGN